MNIFESPAWILSAFLVVLPTILFCILILLLVRKWIPIQDLKANHDVAGFTLGIIGVLYSVVLGFTVVNVQNRSNDVAQTIHTEALCIADLYRQSAFFNPEGRSAVRSSLKEYVNYVIQKEWSQPPLKKIDMEAQKIIDKIWNSYYQVHFTDEKMIVWYRESIDKLDAFLNARLARQFSSWENLGGMMWTILISGALITICFMYFFGLERLRAHIIMTALLAGYISLMLYLVYSLDNLFQGPQSIRPAAYTQVLDLFQEWDADKPSFR